MSTGNNSAERRQNPLIEFDCSESEYSFQDAVKKPKIGTPYSRAMAIARKLAKIGIDPYSSERERYLVPLEDNVGEIIDIGRPLKGTRFFDHHSVRKNIPIVQDFTAFSEKVGMTDCLFWNIGTRARKSDPASLPAELQKFNREINIVFSDLRKSGKMEVLVLGIHPRYDENTGLVDLHAHFICRVRPENRESVKRALQIKFSKPHLPDAAIRNPAAAITYILWGIFENSEMIHWPDHVLRALWSLVERRSRFVRFGGGFADYRASAAKAAKAAREDGAISADRKKQNRLETADPRKVVRSRDRLLAKIRIKVRGKRIWAMLFECAQTPTMPNVNEPANENGMYTSANSFITQDVKDSKNMLKIIPSRDLYNGPSSEASGLRCRIKHSLGHFKKALINFGKKLLKWVQSSSGCL